MMSRHKRNHINGSKQHHHSATHNTPSRHDVLSFRNSDTFEHSLHPHDRLNSQRHRRDLSKCIGTHKQKRRLSVGCSREDIVEVHPQCSEAGDEGAEICFRFSAGSVRSRFGANGGNLEEVLREVLKFHFPFPHPQVSCYLVLPLWHQLLPSDYSVESFHRTEKPKRRLSFYSFSRLFLN